MSDPVERAKARVIPGAVEDARATRAHQWMMAAALAAIVGILALGIVLWVDRTQSIERENDLASQLNTYSTAAHKLDDQVRALGATPTVQLPAQGPQGVAGPAGPRGTAGRGITGTSITGAGHLMVTYTDGVTDDVGQVAGTPGLAGRGITGTTIGADGHLSVVFTDGSVTDVGQVVGPQGATGAAGVPGRGVEHVSAQGGHLLVTYSDGTIADAGQLPAGPTGPTGPSGPAGPAGPAGPPPAGWTWTDAVGRTQTCTRDGGTDAQPTYSCTANRSKTTPPAGTSVLIIPTS